MSTLTTGAALVGIATTAIIYGTDMFCALVVRPAVVGAADSSIADLLGRVHEYGDRRLPVPGVLSVIAAALAAATSDTSLAHAAGVVATAALLVWLATYIRISAPINKRLRVAAINHTTPPDTRALQQRWDSVIWARAILQAVALAGLLTILLSQ